MKAKELFDILVNEKITQFGGTITLQTNMSLGNYNCSPELFRNSRDHYRRLGIFLVVADGHIVAGSDGVVARFDDDAAACKCLEEAGYTREPAIQSLVYWPGRNIEYFTAKYGPDFLKKLELYKTAKWAGQTVGICEVVVKPVMQALVRDVHGKYHNVSIYDLDDFVL